MMPPSLPTEVTAGRSGQLQQNYVPIMPHRVSATSQLAQIACGTWREGAGAEVWR